MEFYLFPLLVGSATGAGMTLLACWLIHDGDWDQAVALIASGLVVTFVAFARVELVPLEENYGNGIRFYLGLVQAFLMWVFSRVGVLVTHALWYRVRS